MKINHLTIEVYRACDNDIAFFYFRRDNNKKAFGYLDGGFCTHDQFILARKLLEKGNYKAIVAAVAVELDKQPKNYTVKNIYLDREEIVYTTAPVFTAEELL